LAVSCHLLSDGVSSRYAPAISTGRRNTLVKSVGECSWQEDDGADSIHVLLRAKTNIIALTL